MLDPVIYYRIARWFYCHRIPILPRAIKRLSELVFHCVLPYTADIGDGFQVGYHGFGIVVHARAHIGQRVFVSPEVTIGGRSGIRNVPRIGNEVFIASGARILGDVTIGDGALIGANAVVIHSVPPRSIAAGVPARIIRENIDVREYTGWPGSLLVADELVEAEA